MSKIFLEESPLILKKFLGYLQTVKGKSEKTVQEYFWDLRTFFRYIKIKRNIVPKSIRFEDITIEDIDIEIIKTVTLLDIFEFMNYLATERKNKAAARSRKSSSLKMFFKYLTNKTQQLEVNPAEELETPKLGKRLPKFLSLEQSQLLLKTIASHGGNYKERDYCIITLFLNCGLRLSELVGINFDDIKPDNTLKILGKGNKERIVYLNSACLSAIENYKRIRPNNKLKEKNAFFVSRQNNRISAKTVQFMLEKYLKISGLSGLGYSVHKLRHTAATLMYQYGNVDIRILKDILGHENLGTTEIYTHISSKQMKDAANSNPLNATEV